MKYSDDKRAIIDYVAKKGETEPKRIFDGTFAELRQIHGKDFDGFNERSAFYIEDEKGNKEEVGIVKMTLSHPLSPDEKENIYVVRPL